MSDRTDLANKPLAEVAQWMVGGQPGSQHDHEAQAEFMRRQTAFQQEAADAAKATAGATAQYTKYMLWSVIVLAVSACISALLGILEYFAGSY